MKTKIFLLICFLTGVLTLELSAQKGKNGMGTSTFVDANVGVGEFIQLEVVCDGEVVDVLYFPESYECRGMIHFENGEPKWSKYHFNNVPFTSLSGEVFRMQHFEIDTEEGLMIWKTQIIGDKGSHYRIEMARVLETMEIVYVNTTCQMNPIFLE